MLAISGDFDMAMDSQAPIPVGRPDQRDPMIAVIPAAPATASVDGRRSANSADPKTPVQACMKR